jgi:hypothetical protein
MIRQNVDSIGIELLNDAELGKLFDELTPTKQNQIVAAGFKKAGNIILSQAKSNFKAKVKDSGRLNLIKDFKVEQLKTKIGVKVGVAGMNKGEYGYITRFLNYGTTKSPDGRKYISKVNKVEHYTGKLVALKFFDDAVESKKAEAMAAVQNCIKESFDKTVAKYEK